MNPRHIGERIRYYRTDRGLTQNQLAEKINVSFQQIQKYENGHTNISVNRLMQLAEALKISPSSLILSDEKLYLQESGDGRYGPELSTEEKTILSLFKRVKSKKTRDTLLDLLRCLTEAEEKKTI